MILELTEKAATLYEVGIRDFVIDRTLYVQALSAEMQFFQKTKEELELFDEHGFFIWYNGCKVRTT